ncbi:hypothetical protein AYO44_10615 [Planctomycetaceae bacterium SCGC AG-212-F19]|nr:hypothetical protein AYO44_10615 [Planctomycetaceae bacterium SCGC AG-212-F19]
MFSAIVADFRQIAGVEVITVSTPDEAVFRREAARAAGTLVIAPECDGILEARSRWVEEVHGRLLGPSSAAVRLTADKLALGAHWREHGLPSPPGRLLLPGATAASMVWPGVCKPRHGAGSQAMRLVRSFAELTTVISDARAQGCTDDLLLQPYMPGRAASVAWLIGPRQAIPLRPAAQHLSADGRFHYRGGEVPLAPTLAERAIALSRRSIACVSGLLGYVGVDLVLGEEPDGSGDALIELNPRLTTSYIGLRALARNNLAATWLNVAKGEPTTELTWHPGTVRFTADGHVFVEEK